MATIKLAAVPLWKVNRRRPHAGELKTGPVGPVFFCDNKTTSIADNAAGRLAAYRLSR